MDVLMSCFPLEALYTWTPNVSSHFPDLFEDKIIGLLKEIAKVSNADETNLSIFSTIAPQTSILKAKNDRDIWYWYSIIWQFVTLMYLVWSTQSNIINSVTSTSKWFPLTTGLN